MSITIRRSPLHRYKPVSISAPDIHSRRDFVADSMQQPDEDTLGPPTITLQYPTIAINGTPASWLLQSQLITMVSNPDDSSCDDTLSSLGDSTYDFIDDKSVVISDDEDQDNSNQSDSSNDRRETEPPCNRQQDGGDMRENTSHDSYGQASSLAFHLEDSTTTQSGSTYEKAKGHGDGLAAEGGGEIYGGPNQDRHQAIELAESRGTFIGSNRTTEGSHTLRVFQGAEMFNLIHHTALMPSPSRIIATIKQTMISQGLVLHGPYKLLYVGGPLAKDPIIQKFGAALAATLSSEKDRPSRFNVVPISSFGESSSPDVVLIDSTGLELSVEECNLASFTKREGGNDTISMTLSDQTLVESFWSGSRFAITNQWKLPDIAVFYLSDDDNISIKQTRRFARSFMSRHTVPCIFISQTLLWNKPAEIIALDHMTPHLCLQAYGSDIPKFEIIKRFPIDIQNFLSLDARQLNRNLACLAMAHNNFKPSIRQRSVSNPKPRKDFRAKTRRFPYYAYLPYFGESHILRKIPFLELSSLLLLFLGFFLYHAIISGLSNLAPVSVMRQSLTNFTAAHNQALLKPTITNPAAIGGEFSTLLSSVPQPPRQETVPRKKSPPGPNTDIASFLLARHALIPNSSDKFMINIVGNSHILLRPPYWFTRSRKASNLSFSVSRGASTLSYQVSALFDGLFAIEIPREDAYGVLKVSVWTTSKPRINESFDVDFGASWLRFARLVDAGHKIRSFLRTDLSLISSGLPGLYNCTKGKLQYLVHEVQEKAEEIQTEAGRIGMASFNQTAKTKNIIFMRVLEIPHSLSKRLASGNVAASKRIMRHAEHLHKDLIASVAKRSLMVSRQAQRLSQAACSINVKAFTRDVNEYRKRHKRLIQKRGLKFWWKIRGLPDYKISNVKASTNASMMKGKSGHKKRTTR